MAMNLRCDNYFVEDEAWHEAADRYAGFLEQHKDKKLFFWNLELDLIRRLLYVSLLKRW